MKEIKEEKLIKNNVDTSEKQIHLKPLKEGWGGAENIL